MHDLRLAGVSKRFAQKQGGSIAALDGVDLQVRAGELLTLVGRSGCGKTTLLRAIAGLEELTGGEIFLGEKRLDTLPPEKRSTSMAFQQPALYPHMTVAENLGFPLMLRKVSGGEREKRVAEISAMLGLENLRERLPETLSGGEQQRVALGRALIVRPELLLLDEPLSNLDAQTRLGLRREIRRLQRRTGVTCIFVTHDQTEAMALGDRVAVMERGRILQCAAPGEIYRQPENHFVASFIGSPPINSFPAKLRAGKLLVGQPEKPLVEVAMQIGVSAKDDESVVAAIRPEDIRFRAEGITAMVDQVEELGSEALVYCTVAGESFVVRVGGGEVPKNGEVAVEFRADRWHVFEGGTGRRIQ